MSTPARNDGREGGSGCCCADVAPRQRRTNAAVAATLRGISGSWFPTFRGSARRQARSRHRDGDGVGLNERFGPAVDDLVLVLQLARQSLQRAFQTHSTEKWH